MPVEFNSMAEGRATHVRVSGKLTRQDYEHSTPKIEKLIAKPGKVRVLLDMDEFEGWRDDAFPENSPFEKKHLHGIERLAVVGDRKWEERMAIFCKRFLAGDVRYYERELFDEAHEWIRGD